MYIGWVAAEPEDMNELLSIGIMVGNYDKAEKEFQDCRCTEDALRRLDPYWGKYMWGFREATKNGDIELYSKIQELDTGDTLTVTYVWEPGMSDYVDFSGIYGFDAGLDRYGNTVKMSRGFSFKDEGVLWKRVDQDRRNI